MVWKLNRNNFPLWRFCKMCCVSACEDDFNLQAIWKGELVQSDADWLSTFPILNIIREELETQIVTGQNISFHFTMYHELGEKVIAVKKG
ncbi:MULTISPECIES: hypothetical protein [Photorhabdus]|uniref:hypothetical protein n=1 Tax=Photorhabdus TaxID=29487 RepID=UPI0013051D63|nr:hypothetical protein [Photorhabdus asymbiotica]